MSQANAGQSDHGGPAAGAARTIAVAAPPALRSLFFPGTLWKELTSLGPLRLPPDRADLADPTVLATLLRDAAIVVTSWGCAPLSAPVLAAAPRLRLLAHTGASVRPYATPASFARRVRVTQAGDAMAYAVGEQALGLTLALLHRVHRFDHALRTGVEWATAKAAPPRRELRGSVVGVVGASRTGRAYVGLVRALGGHVVVCDPFLTGADADALGVRRVSLDELLAGSTVVSLHAPVLPGTTGMIGARELALMPDGGLLVNTARSALVAGDALLAALRSGRIDAALDVFDEEPLPVDHPLRRLPNVLLTPHEAAGTVGSRRRAGEIVLAELRRFLAGEPLRHEVLSQDLARLG
ncbi:hydroxyacid dehydrogenase [Plantactinospora soyae]|uniref:Phosphoglycerate dehydrogenase-like enzyme n=1 Tax=Plantactinospora soyae TaxID=1544732 RepID=A0A927R350_9ACTN|nr:hydroxyacid dehydrogenase [Plantactinospora soyae]MBE1491473.1 phosphoglycerate dehydrogenase-like enzyme [Plantactinospora soyae]